MSGPARMRQPPPPVDEDQNVVIGRLIKSIEALTHSVNDPERGLMVNIKAIETRVGQVEGKMDLVTQAFRLGDNHEGGDNRRLVGMTPVQLVLGVFGAAMGIIATIQVLAPPIAAFCHALAHSVMTHATPAG